MRFVRTNSFVTRPLSTYLYTSLRHQPKIITLIVKIQLNILPDKVLNEVAKPTPSTKAVPFRPSLQGSKLIQ